MKKKVAIIGGGAAGLVAAISAARNNADVTIYEKMDKVGKKILTTGNGRCNLSNINTQITHYHGKKPDFINEAFEFFGVQKTLSFFEDIGIYPYIDDEGKVYPYSLQASSVLDTLRYEVKRLGIKELTNCKIADLIKNKETFIIIDEEDNKYNADSVIVCSGGKASSQLGSDGSGYKLLQKFGHKLVKPFPALVQLKLNSKYLKRLKGVKFQGKIQSLANNEIIREDSGEILFTEYGVSGPPVLQISRMTLDELNKNQKILVKIDMFPEFNKKQLYDLLDNRFNKMKYKNIEESFYGLINKRLISTILKESEIDDNNIKCTKLNKREIYKIIDVLKSWTFEVTGYNTWQQAQVTAGGIETKDFNNKTLESKKIKNLYVAGEILDIDGDCGGFNLQWAWSSGFAAGYYASLSG